MIDPYRNEKKRALAALIKWCGGSIGQLCKIASVSAHAGTRWKARGQVSPRAAIAIAAFEGCPLTKEQMRPDIKVWPVDQDE